MSSEQQGSADATMVELELESSSQEVSQGTHLLVAKHGLEEREDALADRRVGGEGEDDASCQSPCVRRVAIHAPPRQYGCSIYSPPHLSCRKQVRHWQPLGL